MVEVENKYQAVQEQFLELEQDTGLQSSVNERELTKQIKKLTFRPFFASIDIRGAARVFNISNFLLYFLRLFILLKYLINDKQNDIFLFVSCC